MIVMRLDVSRSYKSTGDVCVPITGRADAQVQGDLLGNFSVAKGHFSRGNLHLPSSQPSTISSTILYSLVYIYTMG
jgi:hypothetical protein